MKRQVLCRTIQPFVKEVHGFGFIGRSNVDVGLHGLVVAVAGPFHDHHRRNADGQGVADEGLTGRVRAHELPFGIDLFDAVSDRKSVV